jgi:hypothetical protein
MVSNRVRCWRCPNFSANIAEANGLTPKLLLGLASTLVLVSELHEIHDRTSLSDGSGSHQIPLSADAEGECKLSSQSHIATDGQSVCLSWRRRAPSRAHDQIFILP